jgi:hypothetical protein
MISNLFKGPALFTLLRYLLAAIGGVLTTEHGFDPTKWEAVSGALLVLVPTVLGLKATLTPKVVTKEGTTVTQKDMTATEKKEVNAAATQAAGRKPTWFEKIFKR